MGPTITQGQADALLSITAQVQGAQQAIQKIDSISAPIKKVGEAATLATRQVDTLFKTMKNVRIPTTTMTDIVPTKQLISAKQIMNEFSNSLTAARLSWMDNLIKANSGFSNFAANFANNMSNAGGKMVSWGKDTQWLGRQFMYNVTVPLIGVGVAVGKMALDFDQNMAKVAAAAGTTMSSTDADFMLMKNAATEMGRTTLFSSKEAADGLYEFVSAGFSAKQSAEQLPTAIRFAEAAQIGLGDATQFSSEMLHQWSGKGYDLQKIMDIVSVSVQKSQAHFTDFTHNVEMSSQFANVAGVSFENLAAAMMVMADRGVPAARAGFNLRQAFSQMIKPSQQAQEILDQLGLSYWTAEGKMKNFPQILSEIRKATVGMTDEQKTNTLQTLFNVRAGTAMLSLLQGTDEEYQRYTDIVNNASGATLEMALTMEKSNWGKFKIAINALTESLRKLGEQLLPIIIPKFVTLVKKIEEWSDKFNNLSPYVKNIIIDVGLLVAAVGPLLIVIGMMSEGFGLLFKIISAPIRFIEFIGMLTNLRQEMTTGQIAAGLFTGKIGDMAKKTKNATDASSNLATGWNTLGLTTIGLVIGITAISTELGYFKDKTNNAIDSYNRMVSVLGKGNKIIEESKLGWQDMVWAAADAVISFATVIPMFSESGGLIGGLENYGKKAVAAESATASMRAEISKEFNIPAVELKDLDSSELERKLNELRGKITQEASNVGRIYTISLSQGMSSDDAIAELQRVGELVSNAQKDAFIAQQFDAENIGASFTQGISLGMSSTDVVEALKLSGEKITLAMLQPQITNLVNANQTGEAFTMAIAAGANVPSAIAAIQTAGGNVTTQMLVQLASANPSMRQQAVDYLVKVKEGLQDPSKKNEIQTAINSIVGMTNIAGITGANGAAAGASFMNNFNAQMKANAKVFESYTETTWDATGMHLQTKIRENYHNGGLIYHLGGIVDKFKAHNGLNMLKSDERPAILQTGEFVMSRRGIKGVSSFLETLNKGINPLGALTPIPATNSASNYQVSYNLNPGIVIASDGELREFQRKMKQMENQENRRIGG